MFLLKENDDCAILLIDKILSRISECTIKYIIYYLLEGV